MIEIIETTINADSISLLNKVTESLYEAGNIRLKQQENINKEYLHKILIALADNKPVARLIIYSNPYLQYKGIKAACIGNFESINDPGISGKLLNNAFNIIKSELKTNLVIGPMNGSTWDSYRFSIHHQYPNFFLEPYHHLYYNQLFENAGFKILANYISSLDTQLAHSPPEILHLQKHFAESGVQIRNIDPVNFESELEKVYQLSVEAFKTNFLYTPVSFSIFKEKYLAVKPLVNPDFVLMAEDKNKELIGFLFAIDDLYNNPGNSIIIKTIARKNEKKWKGLGSILGNEVVKRAAEKKYKNAIHAFMIEDATSRNLSANFMGIIYKKYVLYEKAI